MHFEVRPVSRGNASFGMPLRLACCATIEEVAIATLPRYFPSTSSERWIREGVVETAFRRHYGDVYRFLLRRTGDPHEAEELGQRVFADAAAAEQQLERDRRPLLPWLLAVAQRRWVDELRRPYRRQGSLETLGEGLAADERGSASESDLANVLQGAFTNLPSAQREVVLRRLLHGQSFREIAADLETTEGAVKMRFRRGLELLRERLRDKGYAP